MAAFSTANVLSKLRKDRIVKTFVQKLKRAIVRNLPESENYETLGGLIVHVAQEIPQEKDDVQIDNFQFTIEEVSSTKIDVVLLKIMDVE